MRILLVEDDHPLATTLVAMLRDHHLTVDWLDDGRQALNALLHERFDAVVLDLTLPSLDGLEVLRRARAAGVTCPVIALTARSQLDDRVQGLDAGADDYLAKPFALSELLARLRAVTRRAVGQSSPRIDVGPLSIDPANHEVLLAGVLLTLSRSEFMVLEPLARQAGKVVTRARLEEQLYGWDGGVESNTLEVHIHGLRRKLGKQAIRTLRGVGYQLDPTAIGGVEA